MEKRFYWGLGILAVFLALGILTTLCLDQASEPISTQLEQAAEKALGGEWAESLRLAQEAKANWQDSWHRIAMVADHTPMDEIDSLFAQMDIHGQAGDTVVFGGYCARLSELVEAVADAHRFNWWNLL